MQTYDIAPETIPHAHVAQILDTTLRHGQTAHDRFIGYRDYTILLLALMCGLREHEIVALTISDVFDSDQRARAQISLRVFKGCGRDSAPQRVLVPSVLRDVLESFLRSKHAARQSLGAESPLFAGRAGAALSTRQVRGAFHVWQERAGLRLDTPYNFHMLRHTAITEVYKQTKDLVVAQQVARHKRIQTTLIYTHPSRESIGQAMDAAASTWATPSSKQILSRR